MDIQLRSNAIHGRRLRKRIYTCLVLLQKLSLLHNKLFIELAMLPNCFLCAGVYLSLLVLFAVLMDFIIIFRITPHSCNKGVTSSSTDKNLYQNGIILITFAIRKSSCKPACGTFALEQRRSRLYVLRIVALPSFIGY